MKKIFLVTLLIAMIACAGVLVALVAFGILSLPSASSNETVIVINDMHLAEIPVYELTDPTGMDAYKGVKLGLEFSLEKNVEQAILEYFSVLVYSGSQQYQPSAFISDQYYDNNGYWNETDPAIPDHIIELPLECIFEWQPQWSDGTRGYGIDRPCVLPPLNQSGVTVRVTALGIRWLEDGEWKSEHFTDTAENRIQFELPVLNTITLKGNPSLSETPIAPDVYP